MSTLTSPCRPCKHGRLSSLDSSEFCDGNSSLSASDTTSLDDAYNSEGNSSIIVRSSNERVTSTKRYKKEKLSMGFTASLAADQMFTHVEPDTEAAAATKTALPIAAAQLPSHNENKEDVLSIIRRMVTGIIAHWSSDSKLLNEATIRMVLRRVRPILMSEPMLLRVEAPVNVCGDLHGQITDLIEIFKAGGPPPATRYLFLGDYVDRGKYGTEVITVLLGLKILYPPMVSILRGNHETDSICRMYGFFDEVKRRFSVKLFKEFTDVFNCLPIAALIEGIALCMHGGISPELRSLRQIEQLSRPLVIADEGLACDLLWSDPLEGSDDWLPNDRGVSYTFGVKQVRKICSTLGIDIILRAHQVVDSGYTFFAGRKLVTIFSASNYCGEFTNSGAMLIMDANCKCSFQIFKPQYN